MAKRDIIVIGASAGGVKALVDMVKMLPKNFKASIFIVVHISPTYPSQLPEILGWFSDLKAIHPKDGEKIRQGMIYVAPPDHHLLLEHNHVLVKKGPKENRFRPSIDALFRSAAYVYGPRVIGVVLTGMLNDGTSGLWSVNRLGGLTIVQDPNDAEYPHMPQNALEYVDADYTLPLVQIGNLLTELIEQPLPETPNITAEDMDKMKKEVVIAAQDDAFELGIMNMGELTPFTCPHCHGILISIKEGKSVRYRCHTGHAFTASALLAGVTESIEESLWAAIRSMEETVMLLKTISKQYENADNEENAIIFSQKAKEIAERAHTLQKVIFSDNIFSEDVLAVKENGEPVQKTNSEPELKLGQV